MKYIKNTLARKTEFQEAIVLANINQQALPSIDVATRWNSTYDMIDSSLPYQQAFENLAMQDANYHHCPTSDEWIELWTMHDFLGIFKQGMPFLFYSPFPSFLG